MTSTPIADMVEQMFAESAPAAAIVAAIRAMERVTLRHVTVTSPSRDASRDGAREKANARARKYRNTKRIQVLAKANDVAAADVTVTEDSVMRHVTEPKSAILPSLLSSSIGEPLKEARKTENARARGTRLVPGAPLSDEHRAIIIAEGIQDPNKLWAEFVDYWSDIPGQRGCKISWSGTLRNRCRQVINGGFQFTGAKNGRRTVHDAAKDLTRTLERIAEFDEPAPGGVRIEEGGTAFRLLPPR